MDGLFTQEGWKRRWHSSIMFPGASLHVYMYLFLFMHVGVHIVYLAASVLPRRIITTVCVCIYCMCVSVRMDNTDSANSQHIL